jgi:hypothetical protein
MVAVLDRGAADAVTNVLIENGETVVPLGEVAAAAGAGAVSFRGHLDLSWPAR